MIRKPIGELLTVVSGASEAMVRTHGTVGMTNTSLVPAPLEFSSACLVSSSAVVGFVSVGIFFVEETSCEAEPFLWPNRGFTNLYASLCPLT